MTIEEFNQVKKALEITEPPFHSKAKRDIPLRDGRKILQGVRVVCYFSQSHKQVIFAEHDGIITRLSILRAWKNLVGFNPPPTIGQLEKQDMRGVYKTPLRGETEMDGVGFHGEPSWASILIF